ncbi:unnamed protein product [Jaminaea pallidilutea]
MASNGPILPVLRLNIDYNEERKKINEFVTNFKGVAPSSKQQRTAMLEFDDAEDDDEFDGELGDGFDGMDLGGGRGGAGSSSKGLTGFKYMDQLQRIADRDQDSLVVDLNDIAKFKSTQSKAFGASLVRSITTNARHYTELFSEVIDTLMPTPSKDISHKDDVLDVIMHQRRERNQRAAEGQQTMESGADPESQAGNPEAEPPFPPQLLRRYQLYFAPLKSAPRLAVRTVKGAHLGKLINIRGIVTRVSEVKPYLIVDAYSCDNCGAEIFQEVAGRAYMPLQDCPSERCKTNKVKGALFQQTRASKFVPFQEVKVQEMADQVPVGHIPRTMTIHLYGPLTRSLSPGDVADVAGIFLPTPYTGFKAVRAGLLTDTYLDAQHVHQLKKQYDAMEMTPEIEETIANLKDDPMLYPKLASSIAPEIYGHEDVKKCLLLLLVGGVSKTVGDGMKIRGDINVCLMGDPGVAKSQLLKYISKVAPRGVYTTGRGSSGVGLTAAVMRDPVTDEMVLEGGALVLADNGIACIDEFDKMEESDRTAIHEVMEQQTISISKAGISTTLNARTSILAAANPLYGRYNPRVSPVDNINLPAALLSRFDILFLILDTPSRDDDERLAQHVAYVHMHSEHPPIEHEPLDPTVMRHYIALARQKRPTVPKAVSEYVVGAYVKLRAQGKEDEERDAAYSYTSARTLLGVLRLSQALARLRFADVVEVADVDEALRLMDVSKASLHADGHGRRKDDEVADHSPISKIYRIIRDMAMAAGTAAREEAEEARSRPRRGGAARGGRTRDESGSMDVDEVEASLGSQSQSQSQSHSQLDGPGELMVRDVRDRILASGWVEDQLQECLREYEDLGVLQVTGNRLVFL